AKVVLAHLKALQTRRDPENRRAWKFRLVRGLYERGFRAEDVRQLFRFIDWLMELPQGLDDAFWNDVRTYEEEQTVPFVTTPERYGIKQGLLRAIESFLQARFGEEGVQLMPEIRALNDADKFQALSAAIATAITLDQVRRACAKAAGRRSSRK